ncbi:response regulator [Pontibacter sp. Tf4]|uniref:response regulator n=1 Tax=Pontibacter sp. Tf4 TaxID=2761620 RepID=UPI0016284886|nr:response regulator [Pontibacter sp. Tf4]MBB6610567.1 response regulator [Pontibacter sp. Tf4]
MRNTSQNPIKLFRTVLLIDDDETTNFLNKRTIIKTINPDQVLVATDGKTALALLKECSDQFEKADEHCVPDLILLDINMPVMDGFTFLEAYKKLEGLHHEHTTVAILTTSLYHRDISKALNAGITQILTKPLTPVALLELIQKRYIA